MFIHYDIFCEKPQIRTARRKRDMSNAHDIVEKFSCDQCMSSVCEICKSTEITDVILEADFSDDVVVFNNWKKVYQSAESCFISGCRRNNNSF